MPHFVHITSDTDAARIRRQGIRARRVRHFISGEDRFVWAFPVLESYALTYQWSRELKRWGRRTLAAVTLRIPDDQPVYVGHYLSQHRCMTAAEAAGLIRSEPGPHGYEVLIPRRIEVREITSVRTLPKAIGWRYWPASKETTRFPCDCPVCMPRAEVKARRYRDRLPSIQERYRRRAEAGNQ